MASEGRHYTRVEVKVGMRGEGVIRTEADGESGHYTLPEATFKGDSEKQIAAYVRKYLDVAADCDVKIDISWAGTPR